MTDILDNLAKEVDKISEDDRAAIKVEPKKAKKTEPSIAAEEDKSLMAQLLDRGDFNFPEVGATVEGKVIEVSSNEIYLELGPFGTGVVLGKEIKDGLGSGKLKIGDIVTATVTDLENEDGFIELSIREASYEKAWDDIESKRDTQEKVTVKVQSANKGGLLAEVNGISGFLPVSQLSSKNYPRVEDGDKNKILNLLKKLIGQEMEVRIIDADRETEKLIVSEKAAQSEKDMEVISNLGAGDVISGEVSGVVDFGAFVKFSTKDEKGENERKLEGLVHISELAWQLIEDPRTIVKVGDKVEAKIIGIDGDKISLSIRALQKDPWNNIEEKYKIGDTVSGTVNKLNHFGAFVYLDKDIHGLAHISEMSEAFPGKNLDELIKVGEKYDWKILSIEPKDHRMGLVLSNKKSEKKTEKKAKAEKEEKKEEKPEKEKKEKKVSKKKKEEISQKSK
ncbi:MAG: S1 RNA-binding domain-containing protein [Candidatus Pacebacteria bacterium]|nr:S1 RNA-binding domain-containing protein [Candidatus Paceibacterota bacterium]MDR3583669.1 S1 RNA-binding domain-containing protein [Candidatus Paceibacterota bacterium]